MGFNSGFKGLKYYYKVCEEKLKTNLCGLSCLRIQYRKTLPPEIVAELVPNSTCVSEK